MVVTIIFIMVCSCQPTAPPHLIMPLGDQALFRVMDVVLTCQFESLPATTVSWTYMPLDMTSTPTHLTSGSSYNITNTFTYRQDYTYTTSVLLIKSVNVNSAGEYSCNGTNGVTNLIGAPSSGLARLYYEQNGKHMQLLTQ